MNSSSVASPTFMQVFHFKLTLISNKRVDLIWKTCIMLHICRIYERTAVILYGYYSYYNITDSILHPFLQTIQFREQIALHHLVVCLPILHLLIMKISECGPAPYSSERGAQSRGALGGAWGGALGRSIRSPVRTRPCRNTWWRSPAPGRQKRRVQHAYQR